MQKIILFFILGLIVIICYSPSSKNNFLNWDDGAYVRDNKDIQSLHIENIKRFFTHTYVNTYVPLTMITYALDYYIGVLNPQVYIYTNILFHLLNAVLVFFLILNLFTLLRKKNYNFQHDKNDFILAAITSILFAVHPIQVESVVWIAERKTVLFTFFYLISLLSYIRFVYTENKKFYWFSLFIFIGSLLSKGTAVSLPLTIIAIDYVFGRKLLSKKVIYEKIPFLILSLGIGIITIVTQGKENIILTHSYPEQLACVSYGFFCYIVKIAVPYPLYAFYPYPLEVQYFHWLSLLFAAIFLTLIIIYRKRMQPQYIFGILFFITNIIFMLQLIPDWSAMMADRYAYIPSIGIFLIVACLLTKLFHKSIHIIVVVTVLVGIYGSATFARTGVWRNNYTLWNDVISKNSNVPIAWNNRGCVKRDSGNITGAYTDFSEAIRLKHNFKEALNNRGVIYYQMGQKKEALEDFTHAIRTDSTFAEAYYNRGKYYKLEKLYGASASDLNKSLLYDANNINGFVLRAKVRYKLGQVNEALDDCDKALYLNPLHINALTTKTCLMYKSSHFYQAIELSNAALRIDPNHGILYYIRGASNAKNGNIKDSEKDMLIAGQLGFDPKKDPLAIDLDVK